MKKIFTIFLLLCSLSVFSQSIYYVRPTGSDANDGSTWGTALKTLQKGLEKAAYGDQVWVAQGAYYPDEKDAANSDLRTASFVLKQGVKIYGGFPAAGTPEFADRNRQTYVTILSGDLLQNDGANFANTTDNAYHVVRSASLNSIAVLDGFTIKGGNADGSDASSMLNGMGGGLLNEASSPTITHCTFTDNAAAFLGGGLLNYNGSSPAITHCTFTNNKGGGLMNGIGYPGASLPPEVPNAPCSPTISNCSFTGNLTDVNFGIANFFSSPTITDCSFTGNTGSSAIGIGNLSASPTITNCSFTQLYTGIANDLANSTAAPSSPTISRCTFTGNTRAGIGNFSATPTITHCTFTGNTATTNNNGFGAGGAIVNGTSSSATTPSSATITHCSFTNNTAESMGGAIVNSNSSATLINCRFLGNSAQLGGAIATSGTSALNALTLTNCTFYGNTATAAGGAILKGTLTLPIPLPLPFPINDASTLSINNSILWGNSAPADAQITIGSTVLPVITYSLVQGGTTDNHNLNTDPQFADAASGNLHLVLGSPAIDAGDNAAVPQSVLTDLDGNPRIYNNTVDLGAYEFLPGGTAGGVIYVKHDAPGNNDGTSWTDAFRYLQDALTKAGTLNGFVTIWVARGTYYPDKGTGFTEDARTATFQLRNNTSLYGGFAGTETLFTGRNWQTNVTILSGEIQNNASNSDNAYHVVAGSNVNHTAVLDGFTIKGGNANGSGVYDWGGAIYNENASPTIANCRFEENTAVNGGAIGNNFSSPTITHCSFVANSASKGGGIYNTFSSPIIANCLFRNNDADNAGGALFSEATSSPLITNCTFSKNRSWNEGGGIYNAGNYSSPVITNSILWENIKRRDGDALNQITNSDGSIPVVRYSLVQGGYPGGTNIVDKNPLFIDAATGDLHLQACSPAINVGNNADVPPGLSTDLEGNPRIFPLNTGTVDMGAYEAQSTGCCPSGNVLYVNKDATGLNNGTSWTDAFTSLQDALAQTILCPTVNQVWVAKGTYYPDKGRNITEDDRAASFILKDGVALYGGFAGGETTLSQRTWQTNVTTLSGEIQNNANNVDNSYHVLTGISLGYTTVLDGFTITGGNASGNSSLTDPTAQYLDLFGGGLFNNASSPVINNCTFSGNTGNTSSALFNYNGSSPHISNCSFTGNAGTAILNGFGFPGASLPPGFSNAPCSPTISNCSFTGNTGGGIGNVYSSATITGCTFSQNGGGISNGYSSPTITNCTFTGNTSGAIMNMSSSATITGCTFTGNSFMNSQYPGAGAITNAMANSTDPPSSATITNCSFTNNTAVTLGGAILNNGSSATLINCRFSGNSAQFGGAIATSGTSALNALTLTNCTFYGNTATTAGGAILKGSFIPPIPLPFPLPGVNDASTLTLTNCILWGNSAPADAQISTGSTVLPVITYSLVQGGTTDNHNLNTDPQFADAASGNLHLQAGSPAIDAGNNAAVPPGVTTDLEGSPRIYNNTVDLGAYEYLPCGTGGIIYVKHDASGLNDGTSWTHAFRSLQDALTRASYCANITQVWVARGTYVPDATGSNRAASFVLRNNLAIYGGFAGTETELTARNMRLNETFLSGEIQDDGNNLNNSYHVVRSISLTHSARLDGFTITGGAANGSAAPDNQGGGIYSSSSQALIINCRLVQNTAQYGGAIYIDGSYTHFINCSFSQNTATSQGGAIYNGTAPSSSVLNCSFSGNTAPEGGGIYNAAPIFSISNSILWGNSGGEVVNAAGQTTAIFYSVVQGGTTDNNNLNTDPLFMNAAGGDLRLQGCSPAINVGNHDANVFTTDADGAPRKVSIIDMGAYEFQSASGVGIVYVKGDATGNNDGTSWTNAFTSLQDALTRASTCGGYQVQIWVAKGTYYPDEGTGQANNSRSATFSLKNSIAIFGGFAGTETLATQRNALQNQTILSGDIDGDQTPANNSYHVVTAASVDNTASLFDVTITAGAANGASAPDNGGGGLLISSATPTVYNCTFTSNTATYGGALYAAASPGYSVRVTRCTFSGNSATSGGAIYNAAGSGLYIQNSRFAQNTASNGGGLYINNSAHITNSLFWNNTATTQGGAIYNNNSPAATIFNCSFAGNTAPAGNGGALYNYNATVTVTNTILWGNSSAIDNSGSTPTVSYTLMQGGTTDNHNLNTDPQFESVATGDLHLQPCSPAIDAGDNSVDAGYEDLDNNPRVRNDRIDMGAYEAQTNQCCPSGGVLFVKHDASGKNTGTSWTDAFTSLQDALAHTSICTSVTQVWVAAGTYYPAVYSREASFNLKNGLAIYGGFAGTEETLEQRDWQTNVTTLSGDVDGDQSPANNSYHVARSTSLNNTAVLDGFTIRGGNANGHYLDQQDLGAGMYNEASSPTITNCNFTNNTAGRFGGAMYNDNGSAPTITNCSFSSNTAVTYQGGGIYNYMSSPSITFCDFTGNGAGSYGGAIYNATGASAIISNCRFAGNTGSDGGAIGNFGSTPTIKNSLFIGNNATHTGGGLFNFSASPNVFNCSFTANTASSGNGGGIYNTPGSTPIITNCILWGNGSEIVSSNTTPVVSYSIVQNGTTDNHNLNTDPQFADAANGDLRLLPGSPAIDAGNNTVVSDGDLDLDGQTRIVNSVVDIGAYEVQGTPVTIVPPADFTLPNDQGTCSAVVNFTGEHAATASGGTGSIAITYEPATGSALPVGLNTVTATASDEAGHTASATFTVTVADKEGPAFTAPVDQEVVINEGCQVVIPDLTTGLSGTDNCGGAVTFTQNHAQGDILPATHGQTFTVSITATDDKDNTTTHTVTLTAADKTAPVPDVATLPDITGECSVTVGTTPTASDPCGATITATTTDPLSYTTPGSYTIRWTYEDGHGNNSTQDQRVVVADLTAPTITAPADVNTSTDPGQCSASGIILGNPSGSDNCGGVVTFSSKRSDGLALNAAYPLGTTIITWTATDGAGLKTTADQRVIVADNEAPGFTAPPDRNVELSGNCSFMVPYLLTGLSGTDACGTVTFIQVPAIGQVVNSNHGQITIITITASDGNGNQTSKEVQLRAVDITTPVLTAPADVTVNVDAGSCFATNVALGEPVTADNCPGIEVTNDAPASYPIGLTRVTWRVTDAGGHTATAIQQVTVVDNINPTIACPANISVSAAAGQCSAEVTLTVSATDNCGTPGVSYLIAGKPASSPYVFLVGETIVTATATDAAGHSATCSFTVTVEDNQPPTISAPPPVTISANNGCSASGVNLATPLAGDNCTVASVTNDAPDVFPMGETLVNWTATDASGNTATATQWVTVVDETPPMVLTRNITVYLDGSGVAYIDAEMIDAGSTDNCSITYMTLDNTQFSCANIGANTVMLIVTDAAGNTNTGTAIVTVVDPIPPEVRTRDLIVSLDATGRASISVEMVNAGSWDNCGVASMTLDRYELTCADLGYSSVRLTVTDVSGQMASQLANVQVIDDLQPEVRTRNITINLDASGFAYITVADIDDGSWDNCGIMSMEVSQSIFDCSNVGPNTIGLIVTDRSGNTAFAPATVTVVDLIPPEVRTRNITVSLDGSGVATITVGDIDAGSFDNCSISSLVLDKTSFNCSNVGENSVTLTVTDVNGNTASAPAIVTVADNMPPTVLTQDITVSLDENGRAEITAAQIDAGSSDNCGIASMTLDRYEFTCADAGTNAVVWLTVTDVSGKSASQSALVRVVDEQPPTITCPANIVRQNEPGQCGATVSLAVKVFDNCPGVAVSYSHEPGSFFPVGETVVTATATDRAGNTAQCSYTITVTDNEKPVVVTQNITRQLNSEGKVIITPADVDNGSTDNCGTVTLLSVVPSTFNCTNLGTNTVTLTVVDGHGNTSTATATVTITALEAVTTVTVVPATQQYSDAVVLTATLSPGSVEGGCTGATSVTFTIGNQEMGTVPLTLNTATNKLEASLTAILLDAANSSEFSPGSKTVTAHFNEVSPAFLVSNATTPLTITPEDARVTYTGSLFSSTSGITSSQATVTLGATIQDISVTTDANGDILSGDIRKARVRFINADNNTPISGWLTPGLVTAGDLTTGTVTYNWSVNIGSANAAEFTIGIVVGYDTETGSGYYLRNNSDDYTVVAVAKPLADFVSGGGYLVLQTPAGLKAGDVGSKNNFGFNVKYNKSGRNLQGSINTIVRRTESDGLHIYQIKGNAMTSLAINGTVTTAHPYPTAIFDGKASIQDITNPLLPISVDGNASLHVEMTDRGEPGTTDGIAITVWDKAGGLWFASSWSGTRTTEQALDAGNLKVSAGGTAPPPPPPPPPTETEETTVKLISSFNPSAPGQSVTFTARVFPLDYTIITIPTGKVTFYDGTTTLRTVNLLTVADVATATYSTSKLKAGKHIIKAVYSGDVNFSTSFAELPQTVGSLEVTAIDPKTLSTDELQVTAYPNPAPYSFNLVIRSRSDRPVRVRVVDALGRVLEAKSNIAANTTLTIGENFRPGIYLAEVVQGGDKVTVKLIKQSD